LNPAGLAEHLGIPSGFPNLAELEENLGVYREARSPRVFAVSVAPAGGLFTTQAVNIRFPAEAAVEALSRYKRLRSVVRASASGPCELVHSGDQWIETARALQSGLNEQSAAPVWRIEGGKSTLWLAGSVHVLKAPFHPLPAAFEQAFTQAQRLALNLSIPDQLSRSLSGNAGVHVSYAFTPSWGVSVPYLRVDYTREFKTAAQTSQVSLVADRFHFDPLEPTAPARMRTNAADPSYWSWSLGAHAQFINGIAAFIGYMGIEGLDHLDLGDVTAGLRFERSF